MPYHPKDEFVELAGQIVQTGKPHLMTVRELLANFYSERRGKDVVAWIKDKLAQLKLTTDPDFEIVYIDSPIELRAITREQSKKGSDSAQQAKAKDPVPRIGMLPAANRAPITVSRDAPISEAITLMLMHNFSQLPVIHNERKALGLISWQSLGAYTSLGKEPEHVRDCLDNNVRVLRYDLPLFDAVSTIIRNEVVLIQGPDDRITGLVTTTDISEQFMALSAPFLILEQIENHIRRILDGRFTLEELEAAADPSDDSREIKHISDLNFGEYLRIIENPDNWQRLDWKLDRATFVKRLDQVRRIRNDVMHFHPDGISAGDLKVLHDTVKFMQSVAAPRDAED